jgi:hypothetical protein
VTGGIFTPMLINSHIEMQLAAARERDDIEAATRRRRAPSRMRRLRLGRLVLEARRARVRRRVAVVEH